VKTDMHCASTKAIVVLRDELPERASI